MQEVVEREVDSGQRFIPTVGKGVGMGARGRGGAEMGFKMGYQRALFLYRDRSAGRYLATSWFQTPLKPRALPPRFETRTVEDCRLATVLTSPSSSNSFKANFKTMPAFFRSFCVGGMPSLFAVTLH